MTDHTVRLVLSFHPTFERFELFGSIYWLPVVMEDGRSVQGFGVHLVAVVA